jgi:hypothetical protein
MFGSPLVLGIKKLAESHEAHQPLDFDTFDFQRDTQGPRPLREFCRLESPGGEPLRRLYVSVPRRNAPWGPATAVLRLRH